MDEPATHVDHPELHHYTDWHGLEGIFTSGVLRAKDYRFLNDLSEVILYRSDLQTGVCERFKAYIFQRSKVDQKFKTMVHKDYGTATRAAKGVGEEFVDSLYKVTFEGGRGPPFARPFIASFCSHSADEHYERRHGLLSQWRGYGCGERYALVFDTEKLEKLLFKESKIYQYHFGKFFDVVYSGNMDKYREWYEQFADDLYKMLVKIFDGEEPDTGNLYEDFVLRACRLKHRGFKEEREVRIVASPHTVEMDQYLESQQSDMDEAKKKKIKDIKKNEKDESEYIELFDFNQKRRLPINRIIVGPHRDKEHNAIKVRKLVGTKVSIAISGTPYIG